ncbi:hypothetical protein KY290_036338 [Solanum tuberosum]|uniref:RNase H family protein n=1 Tax=Solanum tuberosum TaxID=4113 RepID=A0ABQ7TTY1_SOLTU|nr:hypothetical protein KY289_035853 [Solanum tuberosum]KAH0639039.1 hypothetical protein KY285_035625 [Solanum tuberosum]KAH0737633.1 hypothetical protein KY290_036338 [Solanum tuberosum]
MEVNSIKRLMETMSVRVQHSLREGNTLADYFANLVFDFAGPVEYMNFLDVPSKGKKIINLDKLSLPNMRIKHVATRLTT